MATMTFEQMNTINSTARTNGDRPSIGFFSLRNDGDSAIVRIMHDSTNDFEIVTTHQIKVNDKFRRINCIRSPYDPVDSCPLCARGDKLQQRFYVKMIQYVMGEDGLIHGTPVIWERSGSYAQTIATLINNYGPLSNLLFRVVRHGAARSMDTTYEMMFMPEQMCPQADYPIIPNAFDNYTVLGGVVMNRTKEDIEQFIATGNFPNPNTATQAPTPISYAEPTPTVSMTDNSAMGYTQFNVPPATNTPPTPMPNNGFNTQAFNQTNNFQRPVRTIG